jgi:hypothetical protein
MYELADESAAQWEGFLQALHDMYGDETFTSKELARRLEGDQALSDALPDDVERVDKPENLSWRLGQAFSKRADKRYGGDNLRLERCGEKRRATRWCVRLG